jgi:hypothetical protein
MSHDSGTQLTKHDLLTRARASLEAERREDEAKGAGSLHGAGWHDSYHPLISIADALDRHVQSLQWVSRPRSGLPDWLKKRLPFLRIPLFERLAFRFYSRLFADTNHAIREAASALGQTSQAFRYLAGYSRDVPADEKEPTE